MEDPWKEGFGVFFFFVIYILQIESPRLLLVLMNIKKDEKNGFQAHFHLEYFHISPMVILSFKLTCKFSLD
jgi:hypothetical protein